MVFKILTTQGSRLVFRGWSPALYELMDIVKSFQIHTKPGALKVA